MLVTNDTDLYHRILTLGNHGRISGEKKQFWPDLIGFKYKMSNIQAAIGCAQIERIEALIKKKRQIFYFYCKHVTEMPGVRINPQPNGTINGAWMPTVIFDEETGVTREKLLSAFTENIDARVIFWPYQVYQCSNLHGKIKTLGAYHLEELIFQAIPKLIKIN